MSPIIDQQRRMVEAGRIRAGDTGPKGEPRKLDKWRLTSKDRTRLEAAAVLWGGVVKEWEGRAGEFELYTDTAELPIMLLPETEPSLYYELWTKGGCQRRCDGQTELISDGACLCNPGARDCKPHLRFPVLLPDLQGIGSWLVQSTGWNAATEIPGSMALLSRATARGVLMPARLRLEQRVDIKEGKTRRFAVPVVDVDVSFRELLSLGGELTPREQTALPAGYTPIERSAGNGATLAEGLHAAETQTLSKPPRVPLPEDDEILDESGASAPRSGVAHSPSAPGLSQTDAPATTGNTIAASTRNKLATGAQKEKMDILVGTLRAAGHISTRQVWGKLAVSRYGLTVSDSVESRGEVFACTDDLIAALGGVLEDGELHWSPLREAMTRAEAHMLIDSLQAFEKSLPKAAA